MGINGYIELRIKTMQQLPTGEMEFSFHNFNVSIKFSPDGIRQFGLENIYPGDILFTRGRRGNEEENFIGKNPIEDIKIKE